MSVSFQLHDLGKISFQNAWTLQHELVKKRILGEIPDLLLLAEHEPVYTFGKAYKAKIPESLPFPGYSIERGGEATYHGPGQLVLYPIYKFQRPNITGFLREFEKWLSGLLETFQLKPQIQPKATGIWMNGKKIASIGIAVKGWTTYHGAALNVASDLSHFSPIHPCGYAPEIMTSLSKELGREILMEQVKERITYRNPFWCVENFTGSPWINLASSSIFS